MTQCPLGLPFCLKTSCGDDSRAPKTRAAAGDRWVQSLSFALLFLKQDVRTLSVEAVAEMLSFPDCNCGVVSRNQARKPAIG